MNGKAELRARREARIKQQSAERREQLLGAYANLRKASIQVARMAMVLIWITSFVLGLMLILPTIASLFARGEVIWNDSTKVAIFLWAVASLSFLALSSGKK